MTDIVVCEKCGCAMVPIDPSQPVGMTCPNCGWGWATSFIDPIAEDTTNYKVSLSESNSTAKNVLRVIAQITGSNLIQAKRLIENAPDEIFAGKATQTIEVLRLLEDEGINFTVTPSFPYPITQSSTTEKEFELG